METRPFIHRPSFFASVVGVVILAGAFFFFLFFSQRQQASTSHTAIENSQEPTKDSQFENKIDFTRLTLGDGKKSTRPQQGSILSCQPATGGGAQVDGPWLDLTNHMWDATQKPTVDGEVNWDGEFSVSITEDERVLTSNGLPVHTTGVYPVASSDDAYQYDRNPNSIRTQSLTLTIPAEPTVASTPTCVGGEVGLMLTGIPLFSGFDAAGRDAVAHEIQDVCGGHPQEAGQYHYHGPSECMNDAEVLTEHSKLLGYAFDGFGIFGTRGEGGQELITSDLDECHGHAHLVDWDGSIEELYHYHLTPDFPYSVGCFKGEPVTNRL